MKNMKTVRKIVLASAVLICAALVMVPLVSAAGPGQGFSPGGQQNQGQGTMMMPGNGQNQGSGNHQNNSGQTGQNAGSGNKAIRILIVVPFNKERFASNSDNAVDNQAIGYVMSKGGDVAGTKACAIP